MNPTETCFCLTDCPNFSPSEKWALTGLNSSAEGRGILSFLSCCWWKNKVLESWLEISDNCTARRRVEQNRYSSRRAFFYAILYSLIDWLIHLFSSIISVSNLVSYATLHVLEFVLVAGYCLPALCWIIQFLFLKKFNLVW